MDKRRINGLLEAINERRHGDHTWVDKRRINGLCLLSRSLGKSGSFSLNHGMYHVTGTCGTRYSGIGQVLMADAARLAESVVRYAL